LHFYLLGGGWAVSLIWAMMILPLADSLQNCFQNLTSRIAGIDNEQMTGRVLGMGAMMGFGINAIKEQFKTPNQNNSNSSNNASTGNGGGLKGFVARAKSIINPTTNLSPEKDYNGNVNPIRNVEKTSASKSTNENKSTNNNETKISPKNVATSALKTGYNVTKNYLKVGASLAEGKFDSSSYQNKNYSKKKFQNTEYVNKIASEKVNSEKLGDKNEH